MRKRLLALLLVTLAAAIAASSVALANGDDDDDRGQFTAKLNGYNEIVGGPGPDSTGSVSTRARGDFRAKVRGNPTRLEFTLRYEGIEGGAVTQAHPHFAQQHVGGGVFAFLCGGPKPPCPSPGGTVRGEILPSDILGPTAQGVEAGAFDEFVRALRAGAVYVNVHSTNYPEGEIRGQVRGDDD
jgi:hypothetical protein